MRRRPYVETRNGVVRVRWPAPDGTVPSVSRYPKGHELAGQRFADETAAEAFGWDQINAARRGAWQDPRGAATPLREWVSLWLENINVEESTRIAYRYIIEYLILPFWDRDTTLGDITEWSLDRWQDRLRASGRFSPVTIANARTRMHTLLQDAKRAKLIDANPAAEESRPRGKQADADLHRIAAEQESLHASPLQGLLVAERAALLDGWPAAMWCLVEQYSGLRPGEVRALDEDHVSEDLLDVEWQLREVGGKFVRALPKRGSIRDVHPPPFLGGLLTEFMDAYPPRACRCPEVQHDGGPFVLLAPGGSHHGANWRRRVFAVAANGRRPGGGPVELDRSGQVLRDRGGRARDAGVRTRPVPAASWLPVVAGLTPYDQRHSHQTWMDDDGIAGAAARERMGHDVRRKRNVTARYQHATAEQVQRILDGMEARWERTLRARARLGPSAVPELERLLAPHRGAPWVLDLAPRVLPNRRARLLKASGA